MSEVGGLLHGPNFPVAGVPARLAFHGEHLRVTLQGGAFEEVLAESLEISVTGFNEDTLQLAWGTEAHLHAVTIADLEAQRVLLEHAPASVAKRLRRGHSTVHWHRRKWKAIVGVLAGFVLLALVAWWQSEAITMWIANRVSLENEVRIGDSALEQLRTKHQLTDQGVAAETVARIGARLTEGSRYHYRWYVSDDRQVNAFALPGGVVVVNAGMIEAAASAEELAGVLAHEVQHVEHRHTLQQMIHTAGWAAVLAVVLGDVSAVTTVVIHQLGSLRNSRKLEAQADVEGMKALARADIPPGGLVSLFERLEGQRRRPGGPAIALLLSHPATEERIAGLRQLAGTLHCECRPMDIDWPAVKSSLKDLPPKVEK